MNPQKNELAATFSKLDITLPYPEMKCKCGYISLNSSSTTCLACGERLKYNYTVYPLPYTVGKKTNEFKDRRVSNSSFNDLLNKLPADSLDILGFNGLATLIRAAGKSNLSFLQSVMNRFKCRRLKELYTRFSNNNLNRFMECDTSRLFYFIENESSENICLFADHIPGYKLRSMIENSIYDLVNRSLMWNKPSAANYFLKFYTPQQKTNLLTERENDETALEHAVKSCDVNAVKLVLSLYMPGDICDILLKPISWISLLFDMMTDEKLIKQNYPGLIFDRCMGILKYLFGFFTRLYDIAELFRWFRDEIIETITKVPRILKFFVGFFPEHYLFLMFNKRNSTGDNSLTRVLFLMIDAAEKERLVRLMLSCLHVEHQHILITDYADIISEIKTGINDHLNMINCFTYPGINISLRGLEEYSSHPKTEINMSFSKKNIYDTIRKYSLKYYDEFIANKKEKDSADYRIKMIYSYLRIYNMFARIIRMFDMPRMFEEDNIIVFRFFALRGAY
jgi:hypothetical protein